MFIVKDKTPNATIQTPSPATPVETFAALELQKYVHKVTGGRPPLETRMLQSFCCRVVVADVSAHPSLIEDFGLPVVWDFLVVKQRNTVWVLGAGGEHLMRGVYALLSASPLDVRFCMPGPEGEDHNRLGTLALPMVPRRCSSGPRRNVLELMFPENDPEATDEVPSTARVPMVDWAGKMGLAGIAFSNPTMGPERLQGAGIVEGSRRALDVAWATSLDWWSHKFPGKLLARRDGDFNVERFQIPYCTSKAGAADVVAKRIVSVLKQSPEMTGLALAAGPGREVCNCDACTALDPYAPGEATDPPGRGGFPFGGCPRNHNRTHRYVLFLNEIAERVVSRLPEVRIRADFAGELIGPPRKAQLHPALTPAIDLSGRCYAHAVNEVEDCRINRDYWKALEDWKVYLDGRPMCVKEPLAGTDEMLGMPAPLMERIVLDWPLLDSLGVCHRVAACTSGDFVPYGWNLFAMARSPAAGCPEDIVGEFGDILYANAGPLFKQCYLLLSEGLNRIRQGESVDPSRYGEHARCFRMKAPDFLGLLDKPGLVRINELLDEMLNTAVPARSVQSLERLRRYIDYVRLARRTLLSIRQITESVVEGNPERTVKARAEAAEQCAEMIAFLSDRSAPQVTSRMRCIRRWTMLRDECAGAARQRSK